MSEVPIWQKFYLTVEEAAALTNIGQCKLRELMQERDCDFVLRVGSKKGLINRKKLEKFLENRVEI